MGKAANEVATTIGKSFHAATADESCTPIYYGDETYTQPATDGETDESTTLCGQYNGRDFLIIDREGCRPLKNVIKHEVGHAFMPRLGQNNPELRVQEHPGHSPYNDCMQPKIPSNGWEDDTCKWTTQLDNMLLAYHLKSGDRVAPTWFEKTLPQLVGRWSFWVFVIPLLAFICSVFALTTAACRRRCLKTKLPG